MLAALADFSLFAIAREFTLQKVDGRTTGEPHLTLSLDSTFVGAGRRGHWVECSGEVVKRAGDLVFLRGEVVSAGRTLLTFLAILKRVVTKRGKGSRL